MALGDITILGQSTEAGNGAVEFQVAASSTLIYAGEPVDKELGAPVVTPAATNTPVVATDFWAGIAATTSTNTASAAGTVWVTKLVPGLIYLVAPKVAATFDTQAEYDLLVGDRVLIDLTAGVYTILASDSATSGLVIEQLDVAKYPGKVAFSIRNGVSYLT